MDRRIITKDENEEFIHPPKDGSNKRRRRRKRWVEEGRAVTDNTQHTMKVTALLRA